MTDYLREAFDSDSVPLKNIAIRKAFDRIKDLEFQIEVIHFDRLAAQKVYEQHLADYRKALAPFLKLPIGVINDDPPEMEVYQCHGWPSDQLAVVTVADFRRVRKALEGKDDD